MKRRREEEVIRDYKIDKVDRERWFNKGREGKGRRGKRGRRVRGSIKIETVEEEIYVIGR